MTDPATEYNLRAAFGDGFAVELTKDKWLADSLLDMVLARAPAPPPADVVVEPPAASEGANANADPVLMDGNGETLMVEPSVLEGLIQGMDAGPIGQEEVPWIEEPEAQQAAGGPGAGEDEDADMEEVA